MRDRYEARRPANSGDEVIARGYRVIRSSAYRRRGCALVFSHAEGLDLGAAAAFQQDLDLLLGGFQRGLAMTGQLDAALESLQGLIERQVTALQPFDQAFELGQRFFEIGGFVIAHQATAPAERTVTYGGRHVTHRPQGGSNQRCRIASDTIQTAAKRRRSPAVPVDVSQAQVYSRSSMLDPV